MVHIYNFLVSLKSPWIQKLLRGEQSWIHIFYPKYGDTAVRKILDFGDDFIKKFLDKTTNNFWVDVLKSWLYVLASYIGNLQNSYKVTSSPVWYNSKITVGKKGLFIKYWYEKGVETVNDFLDDNGTLLPKEMFENKFNISLICTMQYNSIISAIAKFLRLLSFTKEMYCYTIGPIIPLYYEPLFFYKKNVPILSIKILTIKTKLQLLLSDWTLECHLMVI